MFGKLNWQKDRMLLNDLVFRLEIEKQQDEDGTWELGENCFNFWKCKWQIDHYECFWRSRGRLPIAPNVLEIGIWDGGSLALWFEILQPRKMVGIDLKVRGDSKYFQRYVEARGLRERLKTYWGIDQADAERLGQIVACEFDTPLDLVIDDGSHLYGPTKSTFETLFPLLRPGGLYIIEDWSWSYWACARSMDHDYAQQPPLSEFIFETVELCGCREQFINWIGSLTVHRSLVANLCVFPDFVAVERGDVSAAEVHPFRTERIITRRPQDGHAHNRELRAKYADLEGRYQASVALEAEHQTRYQELHAQYQASVALEAEHQTRYQELHARHLPLTCLSGLMRATARQFTREIKRLLFEGKKS